MNKIIFLSKKRRQTSHAKRRFKQRLGRVLTNKLTNEIIKAIQTGKAEFVEKQSNRVSKFEYNDWVIIYDKNRKTIITAWEKDSEKIF